MTRDDLLKMAGRREIRRRPTFGPSDRTRAPSPSMAPTRGMTPEISGDGPKTYTYFDRAGVAFARWEDARPRVAVTRFSYAEWAERAGRTESPARPPGPPVGG